MKSLLTPAKSTYLLEQGPDYLHQETTEWLSELEFCKTELSFLAKLLDKAFLRVSDAQKLSDLASLEKKVKAVRTLTLQTVQEEVIKYERILSRIDQDQFFMNKQSMMGQHLLNAQKVKDFMSTVRKIKAEIFKTVEQQLKQA